MAINQSLIQSCKEHNRDGQKQLYLVLLPYLRAVANRYLRDTSYGKDVLQESFVKIFKSIDKYDPDKAPIKNWAARIVINTSLNYNERIIGDFTEELIVNYHEQAVEQEVLEETSNADLMRLLKKMPTTYFEVFNLFVIDGYSHKEITEILGINEALSRKKLSRARSWLRKAKPVH